MFQLCTNLSGKRVGVVKEGFERCDDDVIAVIKEATNKLAKAGATVEEISVPLHSDGNF